MRERQGKTKSTAPYIKRLRHVVQKDEMLHGAAPGSASTVDVAKHLCRIFIMIQLGRIVFYFL